MAGNLIAQSATTDNPAIVSYGAENGRWPVNRLQMSHNTLINDGAHPALFVRVWFERRPADTCVTTRNNLLAGLGRGLRRGNARRPQGQHAAAGHHAAAGFGLNRPAAGCRYDPPPTVGSRPRAEFRFPAGTRPLAARPRWLPGAVQTAPAP